MSPDVLSRRLRELERSGLVRRRTLASPASGQAYELTARGQELKQVILALGRFGSRAPFPPTAPQIGVDSTILALRTQFDPRAADDLEASYELRLGAERFHASVAERTLAVVRGEAPRPDAIIETGAGTLAALLWQGLPLDRALSSGQAKIEGDRGLVASFLRLFPASGPAKAEASDR